MDKRHGGGSSPQRIPPAGGNGKQHHPGETPAAPVQPDDQQIIPGASPGNGDAEGSNGTARLSPEEMEGFRRLLLSKRSELLGDMGTMEDEALRRSRTDASGDLSMMPIHMADIGTDNFEQEFTIGLIESEKEVVKEIDAALERILRGTYGICEATRKPIARARLKVKPWARYCVAYERSLEENGRRRR